MQRRKFLTQTSTLGLGISLIGPACFSNTSAMHDAVKLSEKGMFFKLSLAQWSLHRAITQTKTLSNLDFAKTAKELGFNGIEYVSQLYSVDKSNVKASMDKLVRDLRARSSDHGVQNVLIMVDNEGELASSDKSQRDDAIAKHSKWIDAAAELGCHSIRVNLFGTGTENNFELWKSNAIDGLGRLAQYGATNKINVIVENHGGMSSDAGKLADVIKSIGLTNCGTLPDFGNFCIRRDNRPDGNSFCADQYDKYKGVAELLPYAKGVSAKSYDFDASGNETTIDYIKMLKIVKDSGYNGFIGVEYEGGRLNEIDGIVATKALLINAAKQI